ncbi:ferritin-like domain-containing protein [Phyllosticta paracitricarpa]|uniref:Ferritin-like domain-containing protein n=1 Tax=Phyllosticta paracitricarpa TaxID=2016321 RepID=A0ABR1N674_9PEZI
MKFSTTIAVLTAGLAHAIPTTKRQESGPTDVDILQYALTLEHLEAAFYAEGLKNFTAADFAAAGYNSTIYNNVAIIAKDEAAHVDFLTKAINAAGGVPQQACIYRFNVADVKGFLATASVLEGVGVSAYLGVAADIMSKTYLTAAGSILTVEARHSAYLRASQRPGQVPFAQPFDNPLEVRSVYTLASPFVVGCPRTNHMPPFAPFPALKVASVDGSGVTTGSVLELTTPGADVVAVGNATVYAAFITATGPVSVVAQKTKTGFTVTVPADVKGQSYVVLTGCPDDASDDTIVAGPAIIEIA